MAEGEDEIRDGHHALVVQVELLKELVNLRTRVEKTEAAPTHEGV